LLKLPTYGLLRDSFRRPDEIRALRSLWRWRDRHVQEAWRALQPMQKSLIPLNIQLSNAISDLTGVTGQAILRALLDGERIPYRFAKLRHPTIRAREEEGARSLEGHWREDMRLELKQAVAAYEFTPKQIRECDRRLQELMAHLPTREAAPPPAPPAQAAAAGKKKTRKKHKNEKTEPRFDVEAEWKRVCGVDLTSMDGSSVLTAPTIVSVG